MLSNIISCYEGIIYSYFLKYCMSGCLEDETKINTNIYDYNHKVIISSQPKIALKF